MQYLVKCFMIRKQEYLFQHLTFLWCIDYFCATKERQGQELLPMISFFKIPFNRHSQIQYIKYPFISLLGMRLTIGECRDLFEMTSTLEGKSQPWVIPLHSKKLWKIKPIPIYFAGYRPLAMLYELKSPTTYRQSEIFIVPWKPKRQIISPISKHLNEPFNFQKCLTCNFMK